MSFGFDYYGYGSGSGKDGALTPTANNVVVNAYANVTGISGKVLTLGNISNSSKFAVNTHVLVHVSAYSASATYANFGRWHISYITAIDQNTITLHRSNSGLEAAEAAIAKGALVQVVTIPEYTTVTLNANTSITCPQFSQSLGYGGIVAFKCSKELIFNGGHINLNGKGLPAASLRPAFNFESHEYYYGYENYNRKFNFALNCPDGSAFILTEKLTCHEDSRIGNINATGQARTPAAPTELGGANIFLATKTIEGKDDFPKMISKTPSASGGKGRAGCYLATEDWISCDEGLYAYDRITDSSRMSNIFKIKDFGDGSHKAKTNYTGQLNSYAKISAIDSTRKVFTIVNVDNNGLAKIAKGALVMIRADYKSGYYYLHSGRFILARVLDYTLNKVTVDTALDEIRNYNLTRYNFQMVAIPQFTNFTLTGTNSATPKYENGRGGIVAIAVNDTCDLKGGKLLVEGKGGCPAGKSIALETTSNAQMAEKVPIGEGNGSVFILANNLIMNGDTRIGASWSGAAFGGGVGRDPNYGSWRDRTSTAGIIKMNGSGDGGGVHKSSSVGYDLAGGYNSNAKWPAFEDTRNGGLQGAHVLIIADNITGLTISALSTGGQGGTRWLYKTGYGTPHTGNDGGCGFGGGSAYITRDSGEIVTGGQGGYIGGGSGYVGTTTDNAITSGGGSGAFCFVYCNKYTAQDTTYLSSN